MDAKSRTAPEGWQMMENLQETLQTIKTNSIGGGANLMSAISESYEKIIYELLEKNKNLEDELRQIKSIPKTFQHQKIIYDRIIFTCTTHPKTTI